jgi:hypothetical protein
VDSKRRKQPGKLSDKALWVYFIWTKQGIKFHWRLWYRPGVGPDSYPREGGDDITQVGQTVTSRPQRFSWQRQNSLVGAKAYSSVQMGVSR